MSTSPVVASCATTGTRPAESKRSSSSQSMLRARSGAGGERGPIYARAAGTVNEEGGRDTGSRPPSFRSRGLRLDGSPPGDDAPGDHDHGDDQEYPGDARQRLDHS